MQKSDLWRLAWQNVRKNLGRSWISIISIAIGVASVVLIHTAGTFGQDYVGKQLEDIGLSGVAVYAEEPGGLTAEDGKQVQQTFSEVKTVMPMMIGIGTFSTERKNGNAIFFGGSDCMIETLGLQLLHGTGFSQRQVDFAERVVVVDNSLAQKLYGRENIVGKTILLSMGERQTRYTITGVVKAAAANFTGVLGSKSPYFIYVPYTCMQTGEGVDELLITGEPAHYDVLRKQVVRYLSGRTQREIQGQNISGYLDTIRAVTTSLKWVLTSIGGVAFLVAMIGVTGSMLSAVRERRQEIGIYMALGARRQDVLRLILAESVLLCSVGGLLGGSGGALFLFVLSKIFSLSIFADVRILGIVVAISAVFGILAALLPAKSAADLNPIDALRN